MTDLAVEYERAEQTVGQEPNPLSAEINLSGGHFASLETRCRGRFAWHLRRSFTACWRDYLASPATTFPSSMMFWQQWPWA